MYATQVNRLIADSTAAASGKTSLPKKDDSVVYSPQFKDVMKAIKENTGSDITAKKPTACDVCNSSCNTCNSCNSCNTANICGSSNSINPCNRCNVCNTYNVGRAGGL